MAWDDNAFGFADPNMMALLGTLQGLSQFAGASRLPQTMGQALGGAAGGMLKGMQAGQEYSAEALKNVAALDQMRRQAAVTGTPMPSMADVSSGRYQGPDWQKVFGELFGAQTAAPQMPAAPTPGTPSSVQIPQVPATQGAMGTPSASYAPPAAGVGGAVPAATKAAFYAQKYGIDPNFFVNGLIKGESNFDPAAVGPSTTGAGKPQERPIGLGQLKPSTADALGVDPHDVDQNLDGSARYFASLLRQHDGNYVAATQAYGTIPSDLSKMDGNQQMVHAAAVAANGSMPAGGQTVAGMAQMTPGQAYKQMMLLSTLGVQLPPALTAYTAAQMIPPGPMRNLAMMGAYKAAGMEPVQNVRQGGALFGIDPSTGQFGMLAQNPRLPVGASLSIRPGGEPTANIVPGAMQGIQAEEAARRWAAVAPSMYEKGVTQTPTGVAPVSGFPETQGVIAAGKEAGRGQFETTTVYDAYGNPHIIQRSQIPQALGPPAAPAAAPLPPRPVPGTPYGTGLPGGVPAPPAAPPPGVGVGLPGAAPPVPGVTTPPPVTPLPPVARPPEAAAPAFIMNTATGPKPVDQVTVDDMFPGGAGIPQPRGPLGPPTKLQEEVQKDDAARLESYNKEQAANQQINTDLLRLRDVLNRGLTTSNAARIGAEYANLAHAFGADWAYPKGWAPASAAEFDKASTDLVFAALKTLPGQPRVTEITGLQKANPNLAMPREANYQMMNDILARSKWQDERARLGTEFTVQYKGVPLSVFDTAYNRGASLPDVANEYMIMLRQQGAVFPEDVKAGGGPVAPQPTIGTTRTIGGTTYHLTPQGWRPEVK